MPYLSTVPANQPEAATLLSIDPTRPDSLYQLGNANRAIRYDAAMNRFPHVFSDGVVATTLWNSAAPNTNVDIIFQYLKRERMSSGTFYTVDRSIPLAEKSDLRNQSFMAETRVNREILRESGGKESYLTKTIFGEHRYNDGTVFRDKFVNLHLTGATFLEFWKSRAELEGYDLTNIVHVAIGFSTYVFLRGTNMVQPADLFLVNIDGMPVVSLDEFSYDLDALEELIVGMRHPHQGITVATTSQNLGPISEFNPAQLKMAFKDERSFACPADPHVDIKITSIGDNNVIAFDEGDVFAEIWNHIIGRIPAS